MNRGDDDDVEVIELVVIFFCMGVGRIFLILEKLGWIWLFIVLIFEIWVLFVIVIIDVVFVIKLVCVVVIDFWIFLELILSVEYRFKFEFRLVLLVIFKLGFGSREFLVIVIFIVWLRLSGCLLDILVLIFVIIFFMSLMVWLFVLGFI